MSVELRGSQLDSEDVSCLTEEKSSAETEATDDVSGRRTLKSTQHLLESGGESGKNVFDFSEQEHQFQNKSIQSGAGPDPRRDQTCTGLFSVQESKNVTQEQR